MITFKPGTVYTKLFPIAGAAAIGPLTIYDFTVGPDEVTDVNSTDDTDQASDEPETPTPPTSDDPSAFEPKGDE